MLKVNKTCAWKSFPFSRTCREDEDPSFALAIDGSSDTGLDKMNPLAVRIYDVNNAKVQFHFLDIYCTTGVRPSTPEAIFTKIYDKLALYEVPWKNCVAVGVDNAGVNKGNRNSIKTRIQTENPSCHFFGCPCRLIHNVAGRASDSFSKEVDFDVEDLVDIFYRFDKSRRKKSALEEFVTFCDENYKTIVKHVSTRWLSLQSAISRNLQMFEVCRNYFLSVKGSNARFKRLNSMYQDPMTKVYQLFYDSILPLFCNLNLFLQREEPHIHHV